MPLDYIRNVSYEKNATKLRNLIAIINESDDNIYLCDNGDQTKVQDIKKLQDYFIDSLNLSSDKLAVIKNIKSLGIDYKVDNKNKICIAIYPSISTMRKFVSSLSIKNYYNFELEEGK